MRRDERHGGRTGRLTIGLVGLALAGGCRTGTPVTVAQLPPTVRAAYDQTYGHAAVRTVVRDRRDGQDFYTVGYRSADGSDHDVVYNGAGDQVDGQ